MGSDTVPTLLASGSSELSSSRPMELMSIDQAQEATTVGRSSAESSPQDDLDSDLDTSMAAAESMAVVESVQEAMSGVESLELSSVATSHQVSGIEFPSDDSFSTDVGDSDWDENPENDTFTIISRIGKKPYSLNIKSH
jgi:hypothetical protein